MVRDEIRCSADTSLTIALYMCMYIELNREIHSLYFSFKAPFPQWLATEIIKCLDLLQVPHFDNLPPFQGKRDIMKKRSQRHFQRYIKDLDANGKSDYADILDTKRMSQSWWVWWLVGMGFRVMYNTLCVIIMILALSILLGCDQRGFGRSNNITVTS